MPRLRRPRSLVHTARRAAALCLAVVALVLGLRPSPPPGASVPEVVPVAVAATDLATGTVLEQRHLAVAGLPAGAVPHGVVAGPEPLVGRVLAGAVRLGEPLTDARLVGPGLTSALQPGEVAAPVRLADVAVAALVRSGDLVDVLATPPGAGTAEVVAGGAQVLAAPGTGQDADAAAGLLVLAVDEMTAARLAAAATAATLTVSLPRRHAGVAPGPAGFDVGG